MLGRVHLAIHAALIGIIVALVVSIKGFWFIEGLESKLARCQNDKTAIIQASKDAAERQMAAVEALVARYKHEREVSDANHVRTLQSAVERSRAFAAANRVRPEAADRPRGGPDTMPEGADTRLAEAAPSGSELVAVAFGDIEKCGADYAYGMSAYDWAAGLIADGLGE